MWNYLKTLSLVSAICGAIPSFSQDVKPEDLSVKYPDSKAVLLQHTEHLHFYFEKASLKAKSDITREIVLLTDQAANDYNTDKVYHGMQHALEDMDAVTLLPDGDRFKKIKATEFKTTYSEEDNIFYTDSKQTVISYTNLARNAHTLLNYSLLHDDPHFLLPFYFQSYMPASSAVYKVTVPKSVQLGYRLQGLHTEKIQFAKEEGRNEITYTWSVADMPQARYFENAPSSAYNIPHVLVYVKEYKAPHADTVTQMFTSVGDLYNFFYSLVRNVDLGANAEMGKIVASITRDAKNDRDKAKHIYQWVQENMRYVAFEDSMGGFIPRDAAKVCDRRFGDCKDMTSVLVAMCRSAGLKAYFTWIGTRDIPYRYKDVPLPLADNHMICAVKIDDDWILMDGTDRRIPFGNPPAPIQNKEALIGIDAGNFKVLTVPTAPPEMNTTTDSTTLTIKGIDIAGDLQVKYTGYGAWRVEGIMQYSNEKDKEKIFRYLTYRGSDKFMFQSPSFLPEGNDLRACAVKTHFTVDDYARQIGKETYVNLNLQRSYDDVFVDKSLREVSIEHNYKQHLRQVVKLAIPEGYKASYLPGDKADAEPGLWGYKIHYEQDGSSIWLVKDILIETIEISPEQFTAHNRIAESLLKEYKESVVLVNTK